MIVELPTRRHRTAYITGTTGKSYPTTEAYEVPIWVNPEYVTAIRSHSPYSQELWINGWTDSVIVMMSIDDLLATLRGTT